MPSPSRSIGGWKFFVLRFSRLYPLHIATLLLVALVQPLYFNLNGYFFVYQDNDLTHFLLQLLMASNWGFQNALSFNGPIWSISVEVLVYFFFFVMLLATRSWLLNLVVIAACLRGGSRRADDERADRGLLCLLLRRRARGDGAAGGNVFGLQIGGRERGLACRHRVSASGLAVHEGPSGIDGFSAVLLTFTPILLFCLSRDIVMPASLQKVVEAAGNMTYSSYLLHFPIQLMTVIGFAIVGAPIPVYDGTFFGLYIGTTLLASYLIYRYFEAPAQNLIRELLLRPRAACPKNRPGPDPIDR